MSNLETYLEEIKKELAGLEKLYSELSTSESEMSELQRRKLEEIAETIKVQLEHYELDDDTQYPVKTPDFNLAQKDIDTLLSKIFKLDK